MATTIGTAYVQILPSTEGIQGELTEALKGAGDDAGKESGKSFGEAFSAVLGGAGGVAAGAFAAISSAASAAGTAVVSAAKDLVSATGDIAAYGDNIDKASQKLGISAEAYQEWDAVMQHSGSSIDGLRKGFLSISTAMDDLRQSSKQTIDTKEVEKMRIAYESASLSVQSSQTAYEQAVKKHGKGSLEAAKAANALEQAQYKAQEAQAAYASAMEGSSGQVGAAAQAIQALGVATMDAGGGMRSQEDVFADVITALQSIGDESERTAIAQDIFGRSAQELGPLLNTSAEDTQAMRDRVHELGGVMSDDAVKAAAAYQDSLQDMQTAISGLSRNMVSEFLPGVTTVMDGLTQVFSGDGGGVALISEGISQIVDNVTEELPKFVALGVSIVESLAGAIIDNLPSIMQTGLDAVLSFAGTVIDNLPTLIDAGIEIIFALVDGVVDAIPELIPVVVEAILTITDKLTEPNTLMQMISSAFQIIGALAQGMINAIPRLVAKVPTIIANLVGAITRLLPQLLASGTQLVAELALGIVRGGFRAVEAIVNVIGSIKDSFTRRVNDARTWGSDLIQNFIDGVTAKWRALRDAVSGVANTIKSFLGFSEPEEGPLSNFHTYAPDMMKLFADGIKSNEHLVIDQIEESFDFSAQLLPAPDAIGSGVTTSSSIYVTVNAAQGQDPEAIADTVVDRIVARLRKENIVWA